MYYCCIVKELKYMYYWLFFSTNNIYQHYSLKIPQTSRYQLLQELKYDWIVSVDAMLVRLSMCEYRWYPPHPSPNMVGGFFLGRSFSSDLFYGRTGCRFWWEGRLAFHRHVYSLTSLVPTQL